MPLDLNTFLGSPPDPLKLVAERKIQQWIDEGGLERLTNKGQPLDLTENPFVPADLRMAYKVMANANVAPDWIEIGREIETLLARAREEARRFHDAQRRDRLLGRDAPLDQAEAARRRMRARAIAFRGEQESRLRHVNKEIERFNTACPLAHLHRVKLDLERELQSALARPPGAA